MSKLDYLEERSIGRLDVISAVLSNLTVVIQIVALGIVGLSNALHLESLFQFNELVNPANFIILFISFSLIGLYSFNNANKDFGDQEPVRKGLLRQINEVLFGTKPNNVFSRHNDKSFLTILFVLTSISSTSFLYSTFALKFHFHDKLIIPIGFIQLFSYALALICGSVLIFIWIRDQLEKSRQFTEDQFIPNLRSTLIEYEVVKTPKIEVIQNYSISNGNHLIKVKIEEKETNLLTNFDGKRIFGQLSEAEYNSIIYPTQEKKA